MMSLRSNCDPGAPIGGGINPADSYVTLEATREFVTTIPGNVMDPTRPPEDSVTLRSDPVPLRMEVGYSPWGGRTVVQDLYPTAPDPETTASKLRLTGETATEFVERLGEAPSPSLAADLDALEPNPLAELPNLDEYPSLLDAFVPGGGSGPSLSVAADALVTGRLASISLGRAFTARMTADRRLELSIAEGAQAPGGVSPLRMRYTRVGDGWALDEIVTHADLDAGTGMLAAAPRSQLAMEMRMRVSRMRVHRVVSRDSLRAARRSTPQRVERPDVLARVDGAWRAMSSSFPIQPTAPVPFNPFPRGRFVPVPPAFGQTAEERAGCTPATFAAAQSRLLGSGPRRVAFQHGLFSDACTWMQMAPAMSSHYAGGAVVVSNTASVSTYETQADSLARQLDGIEPAGGWLLVGHSNGGVLSRHLAQTGREGLVRGVIAIGSPLAGAPFVGKFMQPMQLIGNPIRQLSQRIYSDGSLGFMQAAALAEPNSPLVRALNTINGPVYPQMAPGSTFLTAAATRNEQRFRRVAIRSQVHAEWQSVRVLCDKRGNDLEWAPGGRRCVDATRRTVRRLSIRAVVMTALSIASAFHPATMAFTAGFTQTAISDAVRVGFMYAVDGLWRFLFVDHQPGDGVVPVWSQTWHGAERNVLITGADSHVGSTRSDLVRRQLDIQLSVLAP
ncbi:MAG: alpha/beta hydrolase [Gemmatimonadaceae bacterium]|nr:alpha/beta hydrolase [Gemmatimonadaceae bacterium]